ncbi:MAG: glucosamine-6-phosphate deaminase [Acidimicrobiales bacterium]
MEVVIVADVASGASQVAHVVADLVSRQPGAVLGLATGSSVEPVYADLARRHRSGELSFGTVRAFLLDEYIGLPDGHPASYRQVITRQVVGPLGMSPEQVMAPDSMSGDIGPACRSYDEQIAAAGGIDLQLLGIGTDGHIGFNEPGSSLGSRTRVKTLTDRTRVDNARFFGGQVASVPRHVMTQGVATILQARHLILTAWGTGKADAVAACVEGPITASVPASALQMHPHATVVLDPDAATGLLRRSYYEEVFAAKPAWQGL